MDTVGEAMAVIAEEAERQGFQVRQTRSAMWHFRKGSDNWIFAPRSTLDVVDALSMLISAGLDWK
ncbi:hypothetical protein [Mangrovihabitans endophyticus]|uniref:Uncharacterized protein n=1 Tax=Mangrovihabitans endophyticus TaxID=1751298 RepID=A0A8J3BXQ6_9ACTN|nr:hypothetical protein [Mangrovihabitans endophyticus]GGK89051.1 hypothetical protein GCM10012284_23870 [Mangrovihabitans endophyticus]